MSETAEASEAPKSGRPPGRYVRRPRSLVPPDYGRTIEHPVQAAAVWLVPWGYHAYPGHRRAVLEVLGNRVTWHAIRQWRKRGKWPDWAIEAMRAAVSTRVVTGQALLEELDRALAGRGPERREGFCVVQADGRDRRGNWRR
jgi:hypothetical protein